MTPPNPLSWRVWPLADGKRWSWLVLLLTLAIGVGIWYVGKSWLLALAAVAGVVATGWHFFVPIEYEVTPIGIRRRIANRTRMLPWHAIRAYQIRNSGIVLYQRTGPASIDLLRSMFIPFPSDPKELISALRTHASHAADVQA